MICLRTRFIQFSRTMSRSQRSQTHTYIVCDVVRLNCYSRALAVTLLTANKYIVQVRDTGLLSREPRGSGEAGLLECLCC